MLKLKNETPIISKAVFPSSKLSPFLFENFMMGDPRDKEKNKKKKENDKKKPDDKKQPPAEPVKDEKKTVEKKK